MCVLVLRLNCNFCRLVVAMISWSCKKVHRNFQVGNILHVATFLKVKVFPDCFIACLKIFAAYFMHPKSLTIFWQPYIYSHTIKPLHKQNTCSVVATFSKLMLMCGLTFSNPTFVSMCTLLLFYCPTKWRWVCGKSYTFEYNIRTMPTQPQWLYGGCMELNNCNNLLMNVSCWFAHFLIVC